MEVDYALLQALIIALAGWIATSYRIVHSRISPQKRQMLIIPLWFVWMVAALGGPVFQGAISVMDALSTGVSLGIGMLVFFVMQRGRSRRSR